MHPLATALEEAGGTAAPRERVAQLRALLRDELARSERELALARSGRERAGDGRRSRRATTRCSRSCRSPAALRADPDAVRRARAGCSPRRRSARSSRSPRRRRAARRRRPAAAGRRRSTATSRCACRRASARTPSSPRSPSRSTSRGVARLRAAALALPAARRSPTRATGARRSPSALRSAETVARLGGRPADPASVAEHEDAVLAPARDRRGGAGARARTTTRSRRAGSPAGSSSA